MYACVCGREEEWTTPELDLLKSQGVRSLTHPCHHCRSETCDPCLFRVSKPFGTGHCVIKGNGGNHRQRWYSQGHRPDLRLVRSRMRRRKGRTQCPGWGQSSTFFMVLATACGESQRSDMNVPFVVQDAHTQPATRKLPCIIKVVLRSTCVASDWKSKVFCFTCFAALKLTVSLCGG